MSNLLKYPINWANARQQYEFFDDFLIDQTDLFFIDTVSDSGSAAVGDATNGVMVLTPSDGTVADNDEVYFGTSNELFKFAADKHFIGRARIQFTETSSGVYNAFVGFVSALNGADTMVDDGGGMRASGSIAAIYKIDGGTTWLCVTRNNGVVTTSTSSTTAGGSSYQELEVEVVPFTTTQVHVLFRVDGVPLKDSTTGLPIVHTVTVASSTEMNFGCGAKLGAGTNNDVLNVDYIGYAANRT